MARSKDMSPGLDMPESKSGAHYRRVVRIKHDYAGAEKELRKLLGAEAKYEEAVRKAKVEAASGAEHRAEEKLIRTRGEIAALERRMNELKEASLHAWGR